LALLRKPIGGYGLVEVLLKRALQVLEYILAAPAAFNARRTCFQALGRKVMVINSSSGSSIHLSGLGVVLHHRHEKSGCQINH